MTSGQRQTIGLVPLPQETILRLTVNDRLLTQMSCSPFDLGELAIGWLFHQEIVDGLEDIEGHQTDESGARVRVWLRDSALGRLERYTPVRVSACSGGEMNAGLFDDPAPLSRDYEIDLERLRSLMGEIFERGALFRSHGGIHCAMLADMERNAVLVFREDIGRSNAVDKVTGWGLFQGIEFQKTALFTTGRISSEMVLKALRSRIPSLISLTTFTGKAYEIAVKTGMTLAGHLLKPRPILVNF